MGKQGYTAPPEKLFMRDLCRWYKHIYIDNRPGDPYDMTNKNRTFVWAGSEPSPPQGRESLTESEKLGFKEIDVVVETDAGIRPLFTSPRGPDWVRFRDFMEDHYDATFLEDPPSKLEGQGFWHTPPGSANSSPPTSR